MGGRFYHYCLLIRDLVMFTWNYSEKVATQATPEQVWEIW